MWRRAGSIRLTRAGIALFASLAALAVALAVVLSGSPLVVARANPVPPDRPIAKLEGGAGACQSGEAAPARIAAIRLTLVAAVGPRIRVSVSVDGRTLTGGTAVGGWTSGAVTVPVAPLERPLAAARVCFALGRSAEAVEVGGSAAGPATAARTLSGHVLPGRFTIEYMRPSSASWWSSIETVARRLGLGHAPSGTWLAAILLLAMGGVLAVASWLVLRDLR
jgi:hypothetical protein